MTSMAAPEALTLADHWSSLATTALLGTDRRPLPPAPSGPVAELLADHPPADAAQSVLDQVGLLAAVRRAGLRPHAAQPPLVPCPPDPRPVCPVPAVRRLEKLLVEWPHLVDEWLARATSGGWSLPAEVTVALLSRYRADPPRRAVVAGLAGELADWLAPLFPAELAPRRVPSKAQAGAAPAPEPEPLPEDIVRLAQLSPDELATTLAAALARGLYANRHRAVLVRLVSMLPIGHLVPLSGALERAGTNPDTMGLALTLADLARTRFELTRELM
jgi:hypothetical protein